ncbi:MAG: hypothetical protein OCD02_22310 [Spirochaetaceae bacterium]
MIKTVAKILITILFILISIYFYKQKPDDNVWGNYSSLIFESNLDAQKSVQLLKKNGFTDILSLEDITIGINNYFDLEERTLAQISNSLDKNDYRYDPYIESVSSLFSSNDLNGNVIYVLLSKSDLLSLYSLHTLLDSNAILYKLGNPIFLRIILNYISFFLLLLILGLGCKKRFIISLLFGILGFVFMDPSSVYNYISFVVIYFLSILIIESVSFSNRYIKRNNVGLIRILISVSLFAMPTLIPSFLDYSKIVNTPVVTEVNTFEYNSLEETFDESSPSISNYFSHFAFQKSYLYGYKYMFPSLGNSVTINEFKKEDYFLSDYKRVVFTYDEAFFKDFLSYCKTTALGRFYLDYGRPFKLELNSLLSLYIKENEYMQIGVIASIMLFASLFFKKSRDKKIKY